METTTLGKRNRLNHRMMFVSHVLPPQSNIEPLTVFISICQSSEASEKDARRRRDRRQKTTARGKGGKDDEPESEDDDGGSEGDPPNGGGGDGEQSDPEKDGNGNETQDDEESGLKETRDDEESGLKETRDDEESGRKETQDDKVSAEPDSSSAQTDAYLMEEETHSPLTIPITETSSYEARFEHDLDFDDLIHDSAYAPSDDSDIDAEGELVEDDRKDDDGASVGEQVQTASPDPPRVLISPQADEENAKMPAVDTTTRATSRSSSSPVPQGTSSSPNAAGESKVQFSLDRARRACPLFAPVLCLSVVDVWRALGTPVPERADSRSFSVHTSPSVHTRPL